jgi:hypothetical protein
MTDEVIIETYEKMAKLGQHMLDLDTAREQSHRAMDKMIFKI